MTATQKTHSCDQCQADYFCARLKTAMAVIQSSFNDSPDPETQKKIESIRADLAAAGFSYPTGEVPCAYATDPQTIRDLTNELIRLSVRIKRQAADARNTEHRCYNEEVHCE
jgi:hypothetical protein